MDKLTIVLVVAGAILIIYFLSNESWTGNLICKPNYSRMPPILNSIDCESMGFRSLEECCENACYDEYHVSSYKVESIYCGRKLSDTEAKCMICKCDLNECG